MQIPGNENELVEEVSALPESQLNKLRERAKNSVYFMAKGVLGYQDVNPLTHGALCRYLDNLDPEHKDFRDRRMVLMPRGHLKTTVATTADSIRIAVRDPDNARILIANETVDNANLIQADIRNNFLNNQMLRLLFGHLVPEKTTGPGSSWSSAGASLIRNRQWKEPTFSAIGVGGAAVSRHFSHIKGDDLIGLEAYESPAKMKATMNWVDSMEGLIISEHETIIDFVGTRWSKRDLYRYIMKTYSDRLSVFRRSITEIDKDGNEFFIYPAKFSDKTLRVIKRKPWVYHAQYRNDPVSDEAQDFSSENIRYFEWLNNGKLKVGKYEYELADLDIVLLTDPNGGGPLAPDEAAITATGTTPRDEVLVLESYGGRPDPDGFVNQIFRMAKRWRPRVIGIEEAGQQNTMYYFRKKMRGEGQYFRVMPLKHGNKNKEDRIRKSVGPLLTDKKLYLAKGQEVLEQQIKDFPDLENDDRIDSLAYGVQLWRTPNSEEENDAAEEAAETILAARNPRTGY